MAKNSTNVTSAPEFLIAPQKHPLGPVCAVVGNDAFLSHEVRLALSKVLDTRDESGFAVETAEGRTLVWRDAMDTLSERSLFGADKHALVIEDADPFVKEYREKLEEYVERPMRDAVLVLEVSTWPANTRLAKAVAQHGLTIRAAVPDKGAERTAFVKQLKSWLAHVAKNEFQTELAGNAADLLMEQLPTEAGILYQEVARLSLLTDAKGITADLVREHVGGWRTRKTWDMIDAAAEGRAADALSQLDRLLAAGEEPHALLPQMASTLRRFAAAAAAYRQAEERGQSTSLRAALEQAGMPAFKLAAAEAQLRQLGRPRARQLYRWLLAADLALKSHNSAKDRARRELETLIIRLSRQAQPAR